MEIIKIINIIKMFLLVETKFKINLYLEQRPCRFLLHPEFVIVIHFFRPRRKYDVNDDDDYEDDDDDCEEGLILLPFAIDRVVPQSCGSLDTRLVMRVLVLVDVNCSGDGDGDG